MDTQKLIEEFKTSPLTGTERIGTLNLSFMPEMETRYRRFRSTANSITTQSGMGLGLLLMIALVAVDAIGLDHSFTHQARSLLLWAIIPAMFSVTLLGFIPKLRPYLALICSIDLCIAMAGLVAVCYLMQSASPGTSTPYSYETVTLTILFAFLFSGLGYAIASFIGLAGTAAFLLTQSFAGIDTYSLYYAAFFLITANCLGLLGLYVMEYSQRREFVAREMLNYLAERDPLTGAVNRRAMEFHLDKVWSQAARDETGVGVMLVDIDNFKELNDTHGHAHGDQQLIKCVEMLKTIARRPWDLAARYGGDEFVVFLYDISDEDMQERTQRLLDQVHSNGESFTVSIGAAHCVATPTIQIEQLLRLADKRLYQSKEQGP